MAYPIFRVRDPATGAVILEINNRVMRMLSVSLVQGASGATSVPTDRQSVIAVNVPVDESSFTKAAPAIVTNGGAVSWSYGSHDPSDRGKGNVMVVAY